MPSGTAGLPNNALLEASYAIRYDDAGGEAKITWSSENCPEFTHDPLGFSPHSNLIRSSTSVTLCDVWLAYNRPVTPKLTCVPPMLV